MEKTDLQFGDRCLIEQKRHGVPNEMYEHKVISRFLSNYWVEVPVESPARAVVHSFRQEVVSCVTVGVDETKVLTYRVDDCTPMAHPSPDLIEKAAGEMVERRGPYFWTTKAGPVKEFYFVADSESVTDEIAAGLNELPIVREALAGLVAAIDEAATNRTVPLAKALIYSDRYKAAKAALGDAGRGGKMKLKDIVIQISELTEHVYLVGSREKRDITADLKSVGFENTRELPRRLADAEKLIDSFALDDSLAYDWTGDTYAGKDWAKAYREKYPKTHNPTRKPCDPGKHEDFIEVPGSSMLECGKCGEFVEKSGEV